MQSIPQKIFPGITVIALILLFITGCTTVTHIMDQYSSFPGGPRNIQNQTEHETPGGIHISHGGTKLSGFDGYGRTYEVNLNGLSNEQTLVVRSALTLLGRNELIVRGKTFNLDCTGVVLAAYYGAGFDLMPLFIRESGNGVKRLHDIGVRGRTIQNDPHQLPQAGDIIIWDNTYDRAGNGKWGDGFTHNGIVIEVNPDGQITYLHHNYAKGIVLARMNSFHSDQHLSDDGRFEVNSPLRMRAHRYINPDEWLSSHLFRAYVQVISLF